MKTLNHYFILSLALVALNLTSCSKPQQQPSGNIVKIGVIGPFSGPDVAVGESGLQGVELAVELHPLLANGDRIELVVLDDKSLPEGCIDAYDRMDDMDIAGVLVLSRSNSALALARRARLHRIPIIATIASHPELTEENPHLIQLASDDSIQGAVAAMFLRDEMLLNRAAIVGQPSDSHARSLADEFARQYGEANGKVIEYLPLSSTETNLVEKLRQWKQQRVEVIYAPVQAQPLLAIMRGLETLNWSPVVMAGDGIQSEMILAYPDEMELVEGLITTDLYSGRPQRTRFGLRLRERYQSKQEQHGSSFTILGAEGAALMIEALEHTPAGYAPQEVQEQLRQINGFEAYSGVISVGSNGQTIRPVYVSTISQGKLEFLARVY